MGREWVSSVYWKQRCSHFDPPELRFTWVSQIISQIIRFTWVSQNTSSQNTSTIKSRKYNTVELVSLILLYLLPVVSPRRRSTARVSCNRDMRQAMKTCASLSTIMLPTILCPAIWSLSTACLTHRPIKCKNTCCGSKASARTPGI